MTSNSLSQHLLERYEIHEFTDESYWSWGAQRLGKKLCMKVEKLKEPLVNGNATAQDFLKFYDTIATQPALSVVHSMKTGAMIASWNWIENQLVKLNITPQKWLDVGCHTGHITSFIASTKPTVQFCGIDLSPVAISTARTLTKESNISFLQEDLQNHLGSYDTISSMQTIPAENAAMMLPHIKRLLTETGNFFGVEPCGNKEQRSQWYNAALAAGLSVKSVDVVAFDTFGETCAYTAFHCTNPNSESVAPNVWEKSVSKQLLEILLPDY